MQIHVVENINNTGGARSRRLFASAAIPAVLAALNQHDLAMHRRTTETGHHDIFDE
jgi:hypothetical protein